MDTYRKNLEQIFLAGVKAVAPDNALLRHVKFNRQTGWLEGGNRLYDLSQGRVYVVGAGKGAAPMAMATEKLLGQRIDRGLVIVKKGHELPLERITLASASHPVPDAAGEEATKKILSMVSELGPTDLLICLFTGGASALGACPARGLDLADLQETTALLLACGAAIEEINAIRKHLSAFGGGHLAAAANGAQVLSLIVSDVIGDDLAAIASGPTAPDPTTFSECVGIVHKYGLQKKLPTSVIKFLLEGEAGLIPETPKPDAEFFAHVNNVLVATNAQALDACEREASMLGYEPMRRSAPMRGEAYLTAMALIERAKKIRSDLATGSIPVCLLAGGETTVTLRDNSGKGGRNQEMALAAAIALENEKGIYALFGGTDGNDGPTDAAGGFALPDFIRRLGDHSLAMAALETHASHDALECSGDLFVTGPTLTNVMDIAVILIVPCLS